MQDVHLLIENIKKGNYNNYVNPLLDISNDLISQRGITSPSNSNSIPMVPSSVRPPRDTSDNYDNHSIAPSGISKNVSIKARREIQLRKLEKELIKLSKRYEQVTDPIYISEIK